MFEAVLASIAPGEPIPQHMGPAIAHARDVVAANARASRILQRELEPVSASTARGPGRFAVTAICYWVSAALIRACRKTRTSPIYRQSNSFSREQFPGCNSGRGETEATRGALAVFRQPIRDFSPYVSFPPAALDAWAPLNHSMDWSIYTPWHDGAPVRHISGLSQDNDVLLNCPV